MLCDVEGVPIVGMYFGETKRNATPIKTHLFGSGVTFQPKDSTSILMQTDM